MTQGGLLCWSCGMPTGIKTKVMRSDSCVDCLADLRSCRGCRHFEPTRRHQCRENIRVGIPNKDKNNFCDFFQMRDVMKRPGGFGPTETKGNLKKRFDDLFDD